MLRDVAIDHVNQAWATDIAYIQRALGFVYLVAVIDWFSRKVLSRRLSNTLDTHSCVEALQEALLKFGKPEIFNSKIGCLFTSIAFTDVMKEAGIRISMDGKGRWINNRFIERLWKSLKHEEVYLKGYDSVRIAEKCIGVYFSFYNAERSHQTLDYHTPDEVYADSLRNLSCQAVA